MRHSDEKLSDIGWETVRDLYREPIKRAMDCLYTDFTENMPEAKVGKPFEMDDDDYSVVIRCSPDGREPFDISFELADSHGYEGTDGGYTFQIDIVEEGGRILGRFAPYNYSDQCWCVTLDDIKTRFELVVEGVDTLTQFVGDLIAGKE